MAKRVIQVSEEAASDFTSLTAPVPAGVRVIIESNARPLAIVRPADPEHRTLSECIALPPEDSTAAIDPDFPKDASTRPHGTDTGLQH